MASGGREDVHEDLEEGGLSRAVRSDEGEDGAWCNAERDVAERGFAAEGFGERGGRDGRFHERFLSDHNMAT